MALWTVVVFTWPPLAAFDQRLVAPPLTPGSAVAQIASAFALLTWPGLQYAALAAIAWWAYRRRLRALALALVLVVVVGWAGSDLLKVIFARARPESRLDVLTAWGYVYPSGHMVAVVACSISVGAVFAVTRRSPRRKLAWQVGASVLVLAVAFDRWLLGAHFVSDLIGGALFGALVAVGALLVSGRHGARHPRDRAGTRTRSAGPAGGAGRPRSGRPAVRGDLQPDQDHRLADLPPAGGVRAAHPRLAARHLAGDDAERPGSGDDGAGAWPRASTWSWARAATAPSGWSAAGWPGTGIPFGLIPAGTGNLLARNLGIPLDEGLALDVAFDGMEKPIDLIEIRVDHQATDYFAVMAGIGIDAVIMQGANPDLKKAVGSAAYFVSAARYANHPPVHVTVQLDDQAAAAPAGAPGVDRQRRPAQRQHPS